MTEKNVSYTFRIKAAVAAVLAVLALILVLQNWNTVETRVLFTRVHLPNAVLLAITFVSGIVVGAMLWRRRVGRLS